MADKFIRLVIATTGEDIEENFNVNQPIQAVKARALQGLPSGSNPDEYVLEYENQSLDSHKKINEYVALYGWQDGTVLELRPVPVVA